MIKQLSEIAKILPPHDIIVYVVIISLVFLLWSKDKLIRSLTDEIENNGKSLARITELLRVLIQGQIEQEAKREEARKN